MKEARGMLKSKIGAAAPPFPPMPYLGEVIKGKGPIKPAPGSIGKTLEKGVEWLKSSFKGLKEGVAEIIESRKELRLAKDALTKLRGEAATTEYGVLSGESAAEARAASAATKLSKAWQPVTEVISTAAKAFAVVTTGIIIVGTIVVPALYSCPVGAYNALNPGFSGRATGCINGMSDYYQNLGATLKKAVPGGEPIGQPSDLIKGIFESRPPTQEKDSTGGLTPPVGAPEVSTIPSNLILTGNILFKVHTVDASGKAVGEQKTISAKWCVESDGKCLGPVGAGEKEETGAQGQEQDNKEPTIVQKAIEGAKNLFKKITSPFSSGGSSGGTGGTSGGTTGTTDGKTPSPAPEARPSTTAQKVTNAVKNAASAVRNAFKPSTPVTTGRVAPLTTSSPGTTVATNPTTGISTITTDVGPSPTTGIGPAYSAPDTAPSASGGTGSSSGGGGSGGFSATPSVSDVVECPADATICAVSPPEGSTVPKNFSIKLLITTRTPMSCRYSQTGPNFDFNGASPQVERFLEDVTAQPVNNHTDFLYGFNEGSYTFYHQCKNSSGAISSLTHNFKVGSQDLNVAVTCTNLKGDELEVCLNATAAEGAEAGKKSIDLAINKDGKTVKIVRLGTEITPEVAAPQQTGKAVVWIIIMMVLLSGILGFLFWRYKHLKNIEEESALKQDTTEIPQTQSAIAYMFGI